jgi:uncharacterized membrane protein
VLAAPVWWRALRSNRVWPAGGGSALAGDSFYFYLTPLLFGAALHEAAAASFDRQPGLVPALVALPYALAGWSAVRRPFALVAALACALAVVSQWPVLAAVWALLLLAHVWAAGDHLLRRDDGRWYAVGALGLAQAHLLLEDLPRRPAAEPAFAGAWAASLWWTVETAAALAAGLVRDDALPGGAAPGLRPLLWVLAGGLLLFGVTGELSRAFSGADLAAGLAVSAWWICFAAGCFLLGFRRRLRALRLAGFAVAGLALLKVIFVDLSTLDALYRVGSALILGVVSLAVAYAYHRAGDRAGGVP